MNPCILLIGLLILQSSGFGPITKKGSNRLENKNGWEIPGLSISKVKQTSILEIEGKRIQVHNYGDYRLSPNPPVVKMLKRVGKSDDTFELLEKEVVLRSLVEYCIHGKPFCYSILVASMVGGRETGAMQQIAFYDEDGDGIFETREPVGVPDVNRLHWIELPEWVKNTQQN